MKLSPSYQFCVPREEDYPEFMEHVDRQLALCRQEGMFSGFDGKQLYYEYFLAENSKGAVVVAHGLSEFSKKYQEFAWYLLNQGYDVFLYDQRCHGRSCRLTDRPDVIHVDSFHDYHKDLHRFVCDVVRKETDGPLYLYSHSMGGAVAALYLAAHPEVFQKAVLSAPMIEPLTGKVSPTFARWSLGAYLLTATGKRKFWLSDEFDPEYPFSRSKDRSYARFRRNMDLRLENPCYRTTPLSIRWIHESVMLRGKVMRKSAMKKLQTPVLMICAECDGVVNEQVQALFAEKCPVCQRVVLPDSTHAMLCGTRETVQAHVQLVLDHFC